MSTLREELARSRGRFALIAEAPKLNDVLSSLESELDCIRCRVGRTLCAQTAPPTVGEIERLLQTNRLFTDLDVLFAPQLECDPLALMRRLARRAGPLACHWPGALSAGRATYSQLGRRDHYDARIDDVLVVRPVQPEWPGDPCYDVERWA